MTMEFILAHPDLKWNWNGLSWNGFQKDPRYDWELNHKEKYKHVMDELEWKPMVGVRFFEPLLFEFGDTWKVEEELRLKYKNE